MASSLEITINTMGVGFSAGSAVDFIGCGRKERINDGVRELERIRNRTKVI